MSSWPDVGLPHSLLVQAWQHLEQRQRYGSICRVSPSWRNLLLSSFDCIDLTLISVEVMQHFTYWLHKHGHTLRHLSITWNLSKPWLYDQQYAELFSAINSATQLRSLSFSHWPSHLSSIPPLSGLTNLTSLRQYWCFQDWPSQYHLTQLKSLDLSYPSAKLEQLPTLVNHLQQLTRLDLSNTRPTAMQLSALTALSKLQELDLGNCSLLPEVLQVAAELPCSALGIRLLDKQHLSKAATLLAKPRLLNGLEAIDAMYLGQSLSAAELAAFLDPLARAVHLRALVLDGRGFGMPDNMQLLSGLTQLTSLRLYCPVPPTVRCCRH
jgi:Leucine-rich repeat (LRR) protein